MKLPTGLLLVALGDMHQVTVCKMAWMRIRFQTDMWQALEPSAPGQPLFCLARGQMHPEKRGNDGQWVDSTAPACLLWCEEPSRSTVPYRDPLKTQGHDSQPSEASFVWGAEGRLQRGSTTSRHLELSSWQPGATVMSCGLAGFNGTTNPGKLGTVASFTPSLLPFEGL